MCLSVAVFKSVEKAIRRMRRNSGSISSLTVYHIEESRKIKYITMEMILR